MLTLDGQGSKFEQTARALRQAIRQGRFGEGERLPGSRVLADEAGVSRNVVVAAFEQLATEGYLESRMRSGTFVAGDLPVEPGFDPAKGVVVGSAGPDAMQADATFTPRSLTESARRIVTAGRRASRLARRPSGLTINFEYGYARPDAVTAAQLRKLHSQVITAGAGGAADLAFDYGDPAGEPELRRELAQHLARYRGVQVKPEQIVVTTGSQQALDLCARLLLDPGDKVIVEEPGYQGAKQAFVAQGADLIATEVDAHGINPRSLGAQEAKAKLLYLTPSHQFPTGAVMPPARRLELLGWARAHHCYLVEDDYDSEFRFDARPIEAIAALDPGGQVIYLGTFAKSLFPGLRIGFLALPLALAEAFRHAKWLTDRGNPRVSQQVLAQFMSSGGYRRHLRRFNRRYAESRRLLVNSMRAELGSEIAITGGNAGTHIVCWLEQLPHSATDMLIAECAKAGVGVYPIGPYYERAPLSAGLLLGYSSVDSRQIAKGVQAIAASYRILRDRKRHQHYAPVGMSPVRNQDGK